MGFDFNPLLWFVCKLCRKTFPDTDRLKAHKLENHLEDCLKIKCIIFEEKLLEHEWSPPDSNQYNHHHSSQSNSIHNNSQGTVISNSNQSYYETLPEKLNQNFNVNVNLTRNFSHGHDGQERNFENPYVVQIPPAQSQSTSQSQLNPKYGHGSTSHSRFASHLQSKSGFSRRKRRVLTSSTASSNFQDEYQPSSHKQSKIENIGSSSSVYYHPNSTYNNFNNNANQEMTISEQDRDRYRYRHRHGYQKEQHQADNTIHIDASASSSGSSSDSDSDTATRTRNKNAFMSRLSATPKSKPSSSSVQKFDFEFPKSLQVIEVIKPKIGSSTKSYSKNLTDSPARFHPISGPRKDIIDTRIKPSSASASSSYFQSHIQKQRTNLNLNNNNNIIKDNYNNYQMQNPAGAANYNSRAAGGSVKVEFIEYTDADADAEAANFYPTSFLQQSLTLPTSKHNVSPGMTIIPMTSMPGPGSSFTSKIKNQATLKPTFMCNFCALSFPKKNLLLNHLKEHDIERPFQCPDCPSSFKDSGTLRRHQIVHGRVTRHKCSFCGKSFNFRNVLEDHVRTHTGDRPFKCQVDGCEYAFSSKTALNMHTRRKHSEELGLEQFDCVICSKTFGLQSELHKHIQVNHREDKPFKCPQSTCRKSYQSKRQLLKHIVGHTMANNMPMPMSMSISMPMPMPMQMGLQQQQQGELSSLAVPASSVAMSMSIPDIDQDPESSSSSSADLDPDPEPKPDQLQLPESISISMLSPKPKSVSDPVLDTSPEESTIVINESIFENY